MVKIMISKQEFLDKYPSFLTDKDWLTRLNNLSWGIFVHEWYIIDQFFIPFSQYFWYKCTNNKKEKWINYELTWSIVWYAQNNINLWVSIKFDLDSIRNKNSYIEWDIWGVWRWLPVFEIEKLLDSKEPILSEKNRFNNKFNDYFDNSIERTEFYYQNSDHSLLIEEIWNNIWKDYYINRFIHTQFNPENKTILHFDWSYNMYNLEWKNQRKMNSLDKKIKNSLDHIKLFRIDSIWILWMNLDDWISIVYKRFIYNEQIQERFDPEWYFNDYRDILEKNLDY